jgi:hypothetical protein
MVYVPIVGAALLLGLALGGRLSALAELRLRGLWLFYAAILIQIVAFPSGPMPWRMDDEAAKWLWLASYACLALAAFLNARLPGVVVITAGMLSNVAAIVANGGHMPTLPEAGRAAGVPPAHLNSVTTANPNLGWLVDRWAAPDWVPFANVYSVGDVLLALGGVVLVFFALQVPFLVPSRRPGFQLRPVSLPPPLPLAAPAWHARATVAPPPWPAVPPPWPGVKAPLPA